MEAIIVFAGLFVGVLLLDVAAVLWGADSRDPFTDDHRR